VKGRTVTLGPPLSFLSAARSNVGTSRSIHSLLLSIQVFFLLPTSFSRAVDCPLQHTFGLFMHGRPHKCIQKGAKSHHYFGWGKRRGGHVDPVDPVIGKDNWPHQANDFMTFNI
jgi:hypothetical protein